MTTTFERLQAILIRDYRLKPEVLVFDAPLEALGMDSLGTTELLFTIEDAFDVTLPPEAVQLTTLGDVVKFIDDLIEAEGKTAQAPTSVFSSPAT